MIGYVKGILEEIEEDCVIVDVNGLGIRILTGRAGIADAGTWQ